MLATNGTFVRIMSDHHLQLHTHRDRVDGGTGVDPDRLALVQRRLLDWFEREGRDLPWRGTRDPWRILVAEVMLQQIQVARAIPFWEAFLDRFPTVQSLADAPLAAAIRVWADLGRYRRVADLHRTARILVEQFDGRVPDDPAMLRTLPGIGPYTAGAIACFAFERDEAFLDTNIRRVLHRIFVGLDGDVPSRQDRRLVIVAAAAVPSGSGWGWNQALMDLGATICTARKPKCGVCPVGDACVSRLAISERAAARATDSRDRTSPSKQRTEGGNRYYRGRVLEQLRARPEGDDHVGVRLHDLGPHLRPEFSVEDVPWLLGVVNSLAKDGLAIAEERPAYDQAGGPGEVVVKLPT